MEHIYLLVEIFYEEQETNQIKPCSITHYKYIVCPIKRLSKKYVDVVLLLQTSFITTKQTLNKYTVYKKMTLCTYGFL